MSLNAVLELSDSVNAKERTQKGTIILNEVQLSEKELGILNAITDFLNTEVTDNEGNETTIRNVYSVIQKLLKSAEFKTLLETVSGNEYTFKYYKRRTDIASNEAMNYIETIDELKGKYATPDTETEPDAPADTEDQ